MNVIRWIITAAYAAVIFYLSSRPWSGAPSLPLSDKAIHFLLYGGLAFLCAWSLRVTESQGYYTIAALAAALAITYGALDEIHQYFVPGRTCSIWDLVADASGAVGGVVMAVLLARSCAKKRALEARLSGERQ